MGEATTMTRFEFVFGMIPVIISLALTPETS